MIKKILIVVFVLLMVSAAVFYYTLGGFNDATVQKINAPQHIIVGKEFKGSIRSEELGNMYMEVGKITESGEVKGLPAGLYYNDPEETKGQIIAFIGVMTEDTNQTFPEGYSVRVIPAQEVVQSSVNAHFMIAPQKNYDAIEKFAESNQIELNAPFVEWYEGSEISFVEGPIKK